MDPLTLATIVQLIALFVQEQRAKKNIKREDFFRWLDNHHFENLKELIIETHYLSDEVNKLLLEDHKEILGKLEEISALVTDILHHVSGLGGLVKGLPRQGLSNQAVEVLGLFFDGGFMALCNGPMGAYFLPGIKGLSGIDARFFDDDLASLVEHGFLRVQPDTDGGLMYKLTRPGSDFLTLIRKGKGR